MPHRSVMCVACAGAAIFALELSNLAPRVSAQSPQTDSLEVIQLSPDFYVIAGAGSNIAVQTGADGAVVVDAGTEQAADRVVAAIQKVASHPIRYIINTSADADHVGGNRTLAKAGRHIFAMGPEPIGGPTARDLTNGYAAAIVAAEKVLLRMSAPTGHAALFPTESLPTETFPGTVRTLYLNGESIQILREPDAHTDGDSIVFFRRSDVIVAGDLIDATRFPVIDVRRGGSIQGEIAALNRVVRLAVRPIPFAFQQGGTYIVPGHGRVYQQPDVVEYRDMLVIIRDVIEDMIKRGMTLDQIKAASPTKPFERQYGSNVGPWTTDDFVEAVYKGLVEKKEQ